MVYEPIAVASMLGLERPSFPLAPRMGNVHLWYLDLRDGSAMAEAAYEEILAADERLRARQYVFAQHRRRFRAARAGLRLVLGGYLGCDAASVLLIHDVLGKPRLEGHHVGGLTFNLSHSGDLALVAITTGREVGVDIEQVRGVEDPLSLTRLNFHPDEHRSLLAQEGFELAAAFLRIWTKKEAYLKATGKGLAGSLGDFSVAEEAPEDPLVLLVDPEGKPWTICSLGISASIEAALAISAHDLKRIWMIQRSIQGNFDPSELIPGALPQGRREFASPDSVTDA